MFSIFSSIACFLLVSAMTGGEAKSHHQHKPTSNVDFETVAFAQEDILRPMHDQIQNTILPNIWQLSFPSEDPSHQLSQLETLFTNAIPAIRNVTTGRVPEANTTLQVDVEFQLGMVLIRPFLDVLVPLSRFQRTDAFMALLPALDNSFSNLIEAVIDMWDDEFISNVSVGLFSRVEFDALTQLELFHVLVSLGLTA